VPHKPAFALSDAFADLKDPVAAYWAGFIAADGCIHYPKRSNTPRLVFNVAKADSAHLHKIKTWLKSPNAVSPQPKKCVYLCISNARIVEDLESWGITRNKTQSLKPPACDPSVDYAYLRGLIDGDGSVGYFWQKYHGKRQVSLYFKPWLSLLIPPAMVDWVQSRMPAGSITTVNTIQQLSWNSFATLEWAYARLYTGSTPATRLSRKYTKWGSMLRAGRRYHGACDAE
jgi:hypothetical protein